MLSRLYRPQLSALPRLARHCISNRFGSAGANQRNKLLSATHYGGAVGGRDFVIAGANAEDWANAQRKTHGRRRKCSHHDKRNDDQCNPHFVSPRLDTSVNSY